MLNQFCMPALIYLIYSITHVMIDLYKEEYNRAMVEFFISVLFTVLLNLLCMQGLSVISWIIISIPFILMTTIASILLYEFQLNPTTGKTVYLQKTKPQLQAQLQVQTQQTQPKTQFKQFQKTKPECQSKFHVHLQSKSPNFQTQTHPSGYAGPIDTYYKINV